MENLVDTVCEKVSGARVTRVKLSIGKLTCVSVDALRFSFDVIVGGTVLAEAALEITEVAGRGRCSLCGRELRLELPVLTCPCGNFEIEVLEGEELFLQEVEVA